MARKWRVPYPGAIDHVMNRGDRREAIFRDEAHRRRFLETLGETCAKTGWAEKVKVARRLRRETPMTLHWIAQRLRMGATGSAAQGLRDGWRERVSQVAPSENEPRNCPKTFPLPAARKAA